MLIMKRRVGCSGAMRVINRAIALLVLSLLLVGCGGGSSPETFTVTGTITVRSVSSASLASAGIGAIEVQSADIYGPVSRSALKLFTGRVAAAGAGFPVGRGAESADRYVLELEKGQHIVLEFEDSAAADLHLYLLDEFGVALDASVDAVKGPTPGYRTLSLLVPEAGRYIVRVYADRGSAAYSLQLHPYVSAAHEARRGHRVSDDFVVHQVLVRTQSEQSPALSSRAYGMGLRKLRDEVAAAELWEVPVGLAGPVLDVLRGWRPPSRDVSRWASPDLRDRYETLLIARGLRVQREVVAVSPNYILRPQQVAVNDPGYAQQWFHGNIDLPKAWEISTGLGDDADVIVAVVDTQIFRGHEDLQGKLLDGHDFVEHPEDDSGAGGAHGTHVAGIVGAASNNGIGVAGVSWGAKILPVRALTEERGDVADLLDAILYSAGLPNSSGISPERSADVINLSLGGRVPCHDFHDEIFREIRSRGVFLVAAAGNSEPQITFPASCSAVFAVGATDTLNRRAYYSTSGESLDFVAPGGDMRFGRNGDGILSTSVEDRDGEWVTAYSFKTGTSMATAVASGVVALAKAVDPDLTPDRFAEMLECGLLTDDSGTAGWNSETGWGQINALKTLRAVRENRDGVVHPTSSFTRPIHVRLLNAAGDTVAESVVDRQNCRYPYRFENVPEGDYWIVASTDRDADDWMTCSPGEACGAFPTLDNPDPVTVDRDREGVDFSVLIDH